MEDRGTRGLSTGWVQVAPRDIRDRNAIERFFRTLNERTRRFYNNLPSTRIDDLSSFMDIFMLWYNHLRRHQILVRTPAEVDLS